MPGQRPGILGGSPDRIRTGVTALRGRRPRPLDDGAVHIPTGMKRPVGPRFWHGQRRTDYRVATLVANRRSRRRAQRGDQVDRGFDELTVSAGRAAIGENRGVFPAYPDVAARQNRGAQHGPGRRAVSVVQARRSGRP